MTRYTHDPDPFANRVTNGLILTVAAGLLILFVVNTIQFVWWLL